MSRLSEERIWKIWSAYTPINPTEGMEGALRAIEKEAAIYWQERMRERAAELTDQIGFDWSVAGISQKDAAATYVAGCLRNLEIEEPK